MWINEHQPARAFFADRPVLVTGADGFLGMNAVRALHALAARTTIVSRRGVPRAAAFADTIIRGDMRDMEVARAAVRGQSVVLDLVGSSSAVGSMRAPQESLQEDCLPHLNLLQASAEGAPSAVVILPSSRLVYGKPRYLPVDENHPTRPNSIYGANKLAVEHYFNVYGETRGTRFCIFRVSNPYGGFQKPGNKSYGIINHFARLAACGEPIHIFGNGLQRRDYIFGEDLIDILLLAAATPECYRQTFNVGGARPITIRAAAEIIAHAAGGTPIVFEPWPDEHKAVETGDYLTDLGKLSRYLKLPPQTPFEEGVAQTLELYAREMGDVEQTKAGGASG